MVVVNLTGFNYSVRMSNGKNLMIPFYNPPRPVEITDEAYGKFGEGIKILKAPEPKKIPNHLKPGHVSKPEKRRKLNKPLKGVKIKRKRRLELIKYFNDKRVDNGHAGMYL